jgi:hypothetical protein
MGNFLVSDVRRLEQKYHDDCCRKLTVPLPRIGALTRAKMTFRARWSRLGVDRAKPICASMINAWRPLGRAMSLIPGGALSEQRARTLEVISSVTRYIAVCVHQNKVTSDQLKAMTDDYLRRHPTKVKELTFITMGSALGQVCPP